MRHLSAASTVAASLRIYMHVCMHISNFYSGLSLHQYLTFGCSSVLLFGTQMPLDWSISEPLMLVPQHSVSRVRNQSSVCQIPNFKSHFLSFSKHLSLLPITVKDSALGQMLLNWYFPRESTLEDPGCSSSREDRAFSLERLAPFSRPALTSHAMFCFSVVVVWEQCVSFKLFVPSVWVFAVLCRRIEVDMFIFMPLGYSFQERNLSYGERRKDTYWLIQD